MLGFEFYAFGVLNRWFEGREEHSEGDGEKPAPSRKLLCPRPFARGRAGNPENSNSLRGFSTLLFDAGTCEALLSQAGS